MYYEAMMEGRYQPRIDTNQMENGDWEASFEDHRGNRLVHVDSSQQEACRRVTDQVIEGIRNGTLIPAR
jgi:hypothetical protein